jgi:esterase/lipase
MVSSKKEKLALDGSKVWNKYYTRFQYFSEDTVRKGCHPRIWDVGNRRKNSIVLVHGLTDSPYFMSAIGRYFHEELGFNVLLPLLQAHGLKRPHGMKGVSVEEWMDNVEFAIETAKLMGDRVSIGGLSTGGTLSVYQALTNHDVDGAVYLFSAALDLGGKFGDAKELILRTDFAKFLDFIDDKLGTDLIGANPYRYSRIDKGGAQQLSKIIKKVESLLAGFDPNQLLRLPYFVAHSECDITADIEGVEDLTKKGDPQKTKFFRIGKSLDVPHASVVLNDDVKDSKGKVLEKKNPEFGKMMAAIHKFTLQHLELE